MANSIKVKQLICSNFTVILKKLILMMFIVFCSVHVAADESDKKLDAKLSTIFSNLDLGKYEVVVRPDESNPSVFILHLSLKMADVIGFGDLNKVLIFKTQLHNQVVVLHNIIKAHVINNNVAENHFKIVKQIIKRHALLEWQWHLGSEIKFSDLRVDLFLKVTIDGVTKWVKVKTVDVIPAQFVHNAVDSSMKKSETAAFFMDVGKLLIFILLIFIVLLVVRKNFKRQL